MEAVEKLEPSEQPGKTFYNLTDPTNTIIMVIGIGLLIAFIFPIVVSTYRDLRVVFLNIEIFGEDRAPGKGSPSGEILTIKFFLCVLCGLCG
ncbi:MAG: hypothetical protein JSV88_25340 [Candidatus Aminicenantes bacterium]|nr:MAG: hypothetical protein JSV88_25340 [Candidatus Aminicenantes bacterium]